ncbi:MAG TPA: hypothetical protein PKJ29_09685 [Giesbergeria sp.]|nr:hypothetical protein [Giesbergeria sp.]
MHATNMTTAELVRYGLMYSDALPAPVSREALERLDDAQEELEAMQTELDTVQNALDTLGLSSTPATRLEAACEAVAMRCDKADKLETMLLEVAKALEAGRMNKAEREALAQTIYDAII